MKIDHDSVTYRGLGSLDKEECKERIKFEIKGILIGLADVVGFSFIFVLALNGNAITTSCSFFYGIIIGFLATLTLFIFLKYRVFCSRLKEIQEGEDDEFESQ